jgi:hypothetical protein
MKTKRTPLALLEVGVTKRKGQTALDDKWFEKLGQGVRYIDLISSGSVSGQKRKFEHDDGSDYEQSQTSTASPVPSPTQHFGLLTLEKPILFFVIAFGKKNKASNDHEEEQCMNIGCFSLRRELESTTRLALLYRNCVDQPGLEHIQNTQLK